MQLTRRQILISCASLFPGWQQQAVAFSSAYSWPPSVQLSYAIKGRKSSLVFNADAQLNWLNQVSSYRLQHDMRWGFWWSKSQFSEGRLVGDTLQPTAYEEDNGKKVVLSATEQHAIYSHRQQYWPSNGLDRLSILLALGPMVQKALREGVMKFSRPVSGASSWADWQFELMNGGATSHDADTRLQVVKINIKDPDAISKQVWLSPDLHMLPVKLLIEEPTGNRLDQVLTSHQYTRKST